MKTLQRFAQSPGCDVQYNGEINRVSRWIEIQHEYDITPRHSLWYYAFDLQGYSTQSPEFDISRGTYLDCFRWNGRKYALEQFISCGSGWCSMNYGYSEYGENHYLAGYDGNGDLYYPIMIELDEYCEHVRVYQESKPAGFRGW